MKKLIFLLIFAVLLTGLALAESPAYLFGAMVINPEAVLYGDSADNCVVIPDTALVVALFPVEQPVSVDRYTKYTELIIFWGGQYLSGELSRDEYANLVAAAICLLRLTKYNDTAALANK